MATVKAGSKKEETRERILRAAARAIRKHGYEGVGVADVMKEAGPTHGGFYAHFESLDALLAGTAASRVRPLVLARAVYDAPLTNRIRKAARELIRAAAG